MNQENTFSPAPTPPAAPPSIAREVEHMVERKGYPVLTHAAYTRRADRHPGTVLLRNAPYQSLGGGQSRSTFLLKRDPADPRADVRIECRRQRTAGSADERLPTLLLNAYLQMPEETILLCIDGEGFRKQMVRWLQQASKNPSFLARRHQNKRVEVMSPLELQAWLNHHLPDQTRASKALAELLRTTPVKGQFPSAPLPQADSVDRVISLVDIVARHPNGVTTAALNQLLGVTPRQRAYYGNAASFLGLVFPWDGSYALNAVGQMFERSSPAERAEALVRRIASYPVFRDVLEHQVAEGRLPTLEWVTERLQGHPQARLRGDTARRRAQTILRWAEWAVRATN